jgi:hypothetical protein
LHGEKKLGVVMETPLRQGKGVLLAGKWWAISCAAAFLFPSKLIRFLDFVSSLQK